MKIYNMFRFLFLSIFVLSSMVSCNKSPNQTNNQQIASKIDTLNKKTDNDVSKPIPGAARFEAYLSLLKNKRVALVGNQTSRVGEKHLLDTLLNLNVNIVKIFSPEHGFRGNIDRGAHFDDTKDEKTGLPIIAMFGKNHRPKKEQMQDVDLVVFDIQDVGVRFFTYISSMHEVMEACAENNKMLIVLDRPNPNGDYVAGPVRKEKYKSFVGMHPIPVVHGLTVGELAKMINGEGWLDDSQKCNLTVIPVKNYSHKISYSLPVKPSPNLPTDLSIRLYPSLCFFEATPVSVGRGTEMPFQILGYPDKSFGDFSFVPKDIQGMQMNPIQEGKMCWGIDLRNQEDLNHQFTLKYIIYFLERWNESENFFKRSGWFNLLAGNNSLQKQLKNGLKEEAIKKSWQTELEEYKKLRKKYLLYEDFE